MQLNFVLLAVVLTSLVEFNTAQDNGEDKHENATQAAEEASETNVDEAETTTARLEETTEQNDSTQTPPNFESESEATTGADLDSRTENAQNKSSEAASTTTEPTPHAQQSTWRSNVKQFLYSFYGYVRSSGPAIGSICFVIGAMYSILVYTWNTAFNLVPVWLLSEEKNTTFLR